MMQSSRVLDFDENSSSAVDGTVLFAAPDTSTRARPFLVDTDEQTATTTGTTGADAEDSLIPRPTPLANARLGTATLASTNRGVPHFASEVLDGASHSDSSSLVLPRADRVLEHHEDACIAPPLSRAQGQPQDLAPLPCTPTNQRLTHHQAPPPPPTWPSSACDDTDAPIAADEESVSQDLRAAAAKARRQHLPPFAPSYSTYRPDTETSQDVFATPDSQADGALFGAPRNMNTPPPMPTKGPRPVARSPSKISSRSAATATTGIEKKEGFVDADGDDEEAMHSVQRNPAPATSHTTTTTAAAADISPRGSAGHFFRQLALQQPQPIMSSGAVPTAEDGLHTPAAPSAPTSGFLPVPQTPVKERRTVHKSSGAGAGRPGHRVSSTTAASQSSAGPSQPPRRRTMTTHANGLPMPTSSSAHVLRNTRVTPSVARTASALSPSATPSAAGAGAPKYSRRETFVSGSRKRSLEVVSQLDAMDFNQGVDQLTPQTYEVAQQHPANRLATSAGTMGGFSVAHLLFPSSPTLGCGGAGNGTSPSCSPLTLNPYHHNQHNNNNTNSSGVFFDYASSPNFSVSQPVYSNADRLSLSQGLFGAGTGGCGEASQADQELAALLARRILTDFREVRELGRGSFGRVTLYEECSTHQYVAVKASMPFHDRDGQGRRFRREKGIMGMLRGVPHIVQLIAAWEDGGSSAGLQQQLFLQLEFCPGGSVSALAEAMRARGERWDEYELRTFMVHMAIALDAMHARHIAHVDFKPDNVLIDAAGHYTLSDFGCSVTLDEHGRPCSLRQALAAQADAARNPRSAPPTNTNGTAAYERQPAPPFSPVPPPRAGEHDVSPQDQDKCGLQATTTATMKRTDGRAAGGRATGVDEEEEDEVMTVPAPPTLTLAMISNWASSNHGGETSGGAGGSSPSILGTHYNELNLHRELTQTSVASVDEGDCRYLCADMLNAKQYFKAGDLFSLGMSMVELMSGCALPQNGEQFLELRAHAPRDMLLKRGYSPELVDLVVRLISPNPLERPTAREVLLFSRPTADAREGVLGAGQGMRAVCESIATNGPCAQSRYLEASLEGTLWLLRGAQDVWCTAQRPTPSAQQQQQAHPQVQQDSGGATPTVLGPSLHSYAQRHTRVPSAAGRAELCTPVAQMTGVASHGAPWPDSQ